MDKAEFQASVLAAYGQLAATGGLASLDEEQAARLAWAASDDPDVQTVLLSSIYSERTAAELADAKAADEEEWLRMKSNRFDSMCRASCLTDDEAARVEFDRDNGDPSMALKLKERFYFG